MLQNRISSGTLRPVRSELFGCHITGQCDRHVCCFGWTAHALILELLDYIIDKGISGVSVENVKTQDDGWKLPGLVLEKLCVQIVNGVLHGGVILEDV